MDSQISDFQRVKRRITDFPSAVMEDSQITDFQRGKRKITDFPSADMEDSQYALRGKRRKIIDSKRGKRRKTTDFPSADMKGFSSISAETFKHYDPSPAQHHKRYHVFLSYRGADLRYTLVDHLFNSLSTAGFRVFLDTEKLENGEDIGVSLEEAIIHSTVHIPIFSANYASSSWCLDELSFIWNCKCICTGSIIIPLFYDVGRSDLRYPDKRGPYADAFQMHRKKGRHSKEQMDAWKKALHEISRLSGWSLAETAGGYEGRLVKLIVMDLLTALNNKSLHVAKHPEGVSDRMEEVTRLLEINDHTCHVLGVGIWGMGGLGKTTLAKAVYNNIHCKFQASCFVFDVRATAKKSGKGLLNLQKQILQDLAKVDESNLMKLHSVESGKIQMKERLRSIKALVILDDVDDEEQLDALIGDHVHGYWFGAGSRIIITTRDSQVLVRQIYVIQYCMRGLDPKEGLRLFSWHAFLRIDPAEGYEDHTKKIVDACQNLPLSLEAVGAHLYGEKNLEIWRKAPTSLVKVHRKVYNTLKISYDALSREEKRMFLDIACFFLGPLNLPSTRYNMEFYVKLWEYLKCSFPLICLRSLERKSLIKIDKAKGGYSIFWMHDHLRDLGRQIIEEESPNNPANRSRLWCHEDLVSVTAQTQEMPNVEGLVLDFSQAEEGLHQTYCSTYPWALMPNLKFMFISDLRQEGRTKLPPNLIFLGLWRCRFQEDISASGTQSSSFCLPKAIGELRSLRFLDMTGTSIYHLPTEVGELFNLEELYLSHCDLIELPQSLCNLIKLRVLDISYNGVSSFPGNFHQLKSLEVLDLSKCTSLTELPSLDSMYSLSDLKLKCCEELQELPALPDNFIFFRLSGCHKLQKVSSVSHLKKLEVLDVSWCTNLTKLPLLDSMHSLKTIKLEHCEELEELPALPDSLSCVSLSGCHKLQEVSSISHLKKLEVLDVSGCTSLTKLPSLDSMHSLRRLKLERCEKLQELSSLPDSLSRLYLRKCQRLQKMSSLSQVKKLEFLDVSMCTNLAELPPIDSMHYLRELKLKGCENLKELPALPGSLRYLNLSACHMVQKISSNFHMKRLETIYISKCKSLTELLQLDSMLSLRMFKLVNCDKLKELPALPEFLTSLIVTNRCNLLELFSMSHLRNLQTLELYYWHSLRRLPLLAHIRSLKELTLDQCGIEELPCLPESLIDLKVRGCYNLLTLPSVSHMIKLEALDLSWCTNLTRLPQLRGLRSLRELTLDNCQNLQELPPLPEGIVNLSTQPRMGVASLPLSTYNVKHKIPDPHNISPLPDLECPHVTEVSGCILSGTVLEVNEEEMNIPHNYLFLDVQGEDFPHRENLIDVSSDSLVLSLGSPSQSITTDKGKHKKREPDDITALSLALPNPKRLHVSEVNEEGTSAAQEYMDQDGQGEAYFAPPPARNICGGEKSLISLKVLKLRYLKFVHLVSFKFLCSLDIRGTQLHHLSNEVGELLCLEELNLSDCSLVDLPQSFANLINLKVLHISKNHLRSFPVNFHELKSLTCLDASRNKGFEELPLLPEDLISVKVQYCSNLQKMCSASHMRHLESLDLSYCRSFAELPELDSIHSLRELALEHCKELQKLPALPERLISLNVRECPSLHKMSNISCLRYLETLDLSYCRNLIELPDLSSMHSLRELTLDFCDKLEKLPALPEGLIKVSWKESLKQHKMSSTFIMHPLRELKLENCYKIEELRSRQQNFIHVKVSECHNLQDLSSISHMLNLETLELSSCSGIIQLPALNCMRSLRELTLDSCDKLEELPYLPESLIHLKVRACVNLQKLSSMSQMMKLETLDLSSCTYLTQLPQLNCIGSLREVLLDYCENLKELPSLPEGLINLKVRGCCELQKISHMSHMRNLETLDLSLCIRVITLPELYSMHSLRELKVEYCESLEELPSLPENLINLSLVHCHRLKKISSMSQIRKLETLDLSWCMSVTRLPELDVMHSLRDLTLEHCEELEELPSLPNSLCGLNLGSCCKLRKIIIMSEMIYLKTLQLPYCTNLTQISQLGLLKSLGELTLEHCENLEELPCLPEGLMNLSIVGCNKLQNVLSMSCMRLLKTFNLSSCTSLTKLPKLDAMYSLRGFKLEHCENLEELPSLPVNLNNLSLVHCYKLQNISSMCHMRNLETVDLSWCINLSKLPKLNAIRSLRELKIEQCVKLEELPSLPESVTDLNASRCYKLQKIDISNMRKLENLHLPYCTSLTELSQLEFLEYLRKLTLDFCEELEELPALPGGLIHLSVRHCYKLERVYSMSHLRNLESLDLSSCISLTKLPEVHDMHSLRELEIEHCVKLEEFPSLPESVTNLNASRCYKLRKIYMSNKGKLENLYLPYCTSLTELSQLEFLEYLRKLTLDFCEELEELPALPGGLIHLSVRHCYNLERVYSMSHLRNLEFLDLSSCRSLTKLPEVHAMYSLRELKMEHWENLEELPSLPEGLINLSLVHCYKLQTISSVSYVRNLETLDLSWCTSLTILPNFDHMHSLRELMLEHCELEELPSLPKGS